MKTKQKYTGSQSDTTTIPPTIIINITVKGNKNALNVLSPGAVCTMQGKNSSYVSDSPGAITHSGERTRGNIKSQPETLFVVLPENVDELYNLIQQPQLKTDYFAQSHLLLLYLGYRRDENTHAEAMHEIKHAAVNYLCSDR